MLRASSPAISQRKLSWTEGEFINVVRAYLIKFFGITTEDPREKEFSGLCQVAFWI